MAAAAALGRAARRRLRPLPQRGRRACVASARAFCASCRTSSPTRCSTRARTAWSRCGSRASTARSSSTSPTAARVSRGRGPRAHLRAFRAARRGARAQSRRARAWASRSSSRSSRAHGGSDRGPRARRRRRRLPRHAAAYGVAAILPPRLPRPSDSRLPSGPHSPCRERAPSTGTLSTARGVRSLPTEGREEAHAAGAAAQRGIRRTVEPASGRAVRRCARPRADPEAERRRRASAGTRGPAAP